jgi:hypothetical protein
MFGYFFVAMRFLSSSRGRAVFVGLGYYGCDFGYLSALLLLRGAALEKFGG